MKRKGNILLFKKMTKISVDYKTLKNKTPSQPKRKCLGYNTKLYLIPFRGLDSVGYPFLAIAPWSTLFQIGSPFNAPSMNEIDLFKNYSYHIGPCTKK